MPIARSREYNDKDIANVLRHAEPEAVLALRFIYENRPSYSAMRDMLRQHSVSDARFKAIYSYLAKEGLIDTDDKEAHATLSLTGRAKAALESVFDRRFP